jgi:hypothetical protein
MKLGERIYIRGSLGMYVLVGTGEKVGVGVNNVGQKEG